MAQWIDFKELRAKLDFRTILSHYEVKLREKGDQYHGYCPLPSHQGKRNSPSFSVNVNKGIFRCFGCGAQGNVIDFACRMEGRNPEHGADIRKTALELQKRFAPEASDESPGLAKEEPSEKATSEPESESEAEGEKDEENVVVNAPLDFSLKRLDPEHPYLSERGFTRETVEYFGLGYASRGLMQGRIAIPIHDPDGNLVGYAGRVVDDQRASKETPKYKFPPQRGKQGFCYVFRKSWLVYNLHRLERPVKDLIVVEGFPAVWWLHQAGFSNVVALMGASMSEYQATLITKAVPPEGHIWLFPDGDNAGAGCAATGLQLPASERLTRWIKLENGKQPTDYNADDFQRLLSAMKKE